MFVLPTPTRTGRATARAPKCAAPLLTAAAALAALLLASCRMADDASAVGAPALAGASDVVVGEADDATASAASSSGAYLAALAALQARDMTTAADYFLAALEADSGNGDLLRRTHLALVSAGRISEALPIARELVERGGVDQFSPLTLAADAFDREAFGEAADALRRLPLDGYNAVLAPLLEGWAAAGAGDFDGALDAVGPADMADGFDAERAHHIASIEELANRPERAEAAFARSVEGEGGVAYRAALAYGHFLERRGRPDDARAVYRAFRAANPGSLWLDRAVARLDAGGPPPSPGGAREGAAGALLAVANSARAADRPGVALALGRLAAHLAPRNDVVSLLLGDILEGQGRYEDAVIAYRRIDPASPLGWSARLRIALGLDDGDRTDRAIALLDRMVDERPDRSDALATLGDILRRRERWPEAVDAYDGAFARMGSDAENDWRLRYVRGVALERSGDWDRAEGDFVAALEIEPDHPLVLNYLGYTWVDRGEHLQRALDMIRRAVDLRPGDGFIIDSLGWAYYRLGRFEEAVFELERAVEYEPSDPVINDHLGDAFWKVGRRVEARFQWRRALSLSDDDALTAAVRAKLRSGLDDDET